MTADLTVERIVNVYYMQQRNWARDAFDIRQYDAVVLFVQGEIEYTFADRTVTAKAGDLLLLPGNLPYSGVRHSKDVAFYVLDFFCTDADAFTRFGAPCAFPTADFESARERFAEAVSIWDTHMADMMLRIKAILYTLLTTALSREETQRGTTPIQEILSCIADTLTDPDLSVAALCARFCISASQLRRNVLRATGLTPNEYITTLRINKAKGALSSTDKSIREIAADCGFASPYYFSRCFAKAMGITPTQYRALTRT